MSLEMTASASTKKLTRLQLRIWDVRRSHGEMDSFVHFPYHPSSLSISFFHFQPPLFPPFLPSPSFIFPLPCSPLSFPPQSGPQIQLEGLWKSCEFPQGRGEYPAYHNCDILTHVGNGQVRL